MFTPQFDNFVAPARQHNQIWRLLLGVVTIAAVYLGWFMVMLWGLQLWLGINGAIQMATQMGEATSWMGMLLLLPTFGGLALGTIVAAKLIHKRGVATLFGPRGRVLHDFATAAVAVLAVYAGLVVIWSFWFEPLPGLAFSLWWKLLPLALAGVLLQTGAEELVFRGYLQQQLGARFRSPVVWMLLPALGFAALHYDPNTSGTYTVMAIGVTGLFGLIAADLTRITGSLGAAWGFHFANNLFAILLIAVDGSMSGLSIFVTPYDANQASMMPLLIAGDLLAMAGGWFYLRRHFNG